MNEKIVGDELTERAEDAAYWRHQAALAHGKASQWESAYRQLERAYDGRGEALRDAMAHLAQAEAELAQLRGSRDG